METTSQKSGPQAKPAGETPVEYVASFIEFFIWLLVLKTFFVMLFVIPTGSMAETLCGAHASRVCPNCGKEYEVGFLRAPDRPAEDPESLECPNCRWREPYRGELARTMKPIAGDRIVVHGWTFDMGIGPRAWDVVVFRPPMSPDTNYIKRLIGLPGQKVELINGDVFVNDRISRKPAAVQESLWFPFYDHDYLPKRAGEGGFAPHWAEREAGGGWRDLDTRRPKFDGLDKARAAIRFLTSPGGSSPACAIEDIYGYNWPEHRRPHRRQQYVPVAVNDTRLTCEVAFAADSGYVEMSATKYGRRFVGRWHAGGAVELERVNRRTGESEKSTRVERAFRGRSVRIGLGVADYWGTVEVNGAAAATLPYTDADITPGEARELSRLNDEVELLVAAGNTRVTVSHLRVDRDVYYRSELHERAAANGTQGRAITLAADEFFVLGDNSPESLDSRYWNRPWPNRAGNQLGTVPADQMIGPAYFVYWPGFLPVWPGGPTIMPNFGKIRWIH